MGGSQPSDKAPVCPLPAGCWKTKPDFTASSLPAQLCVAMPSTANVHSMTAVIRHPVILCVYIWGVAYGDEAHLLREVIGAECVCLEDNVTA